MKVWLTMIGILGIAGFASAAQGPAGRTQSGPASSAQAPDRLKAIWSYAQDRIDRQTDVWFDGGDFPATIQILKVASELNPHDYEILTNLGWMQENVHESEAAIATYERYQRDNPDDPDAALPIAQYYFLKKQYDKVPPILEHTMSTKGKKHPNMFRILAGSYERMGKFTDAERILKQYIAQTPGDAQAKLNLARVERKMKKGG
jgi:tetratricopeptide (TPR) repeat protein